MTIVHYGIYGLDWKIYSMKELKFKIDKTNPVPKYYQIKETIKRHLKNGRLKSEVCFLMRNKTKSLRKEGGK